MPLTLGAVQLQIMAVLWDRQEATAREITDALGEARPIALSTVQTLLRQLLAKRAVAHEKRERTFVFRPLIGRESVNRSVAQDVLSRVFQGSITGLVAHLLDSEPIPADELVELRKMIDAKVAGDSL